MTSLAPEADIGRLPLKDFQPAAPTRYDASVKKNVDAARTSNRSPDAPFHGGARKNSDND
jgi:hypothetical protein